MSNRNLLTNKVSLFSTVETALMFLLLFSASVVVSLREPPLQVMHDNSRLALTRISCTATLNHNTSHTDSHTFVVKPRGSVRSCLRQSIAHLAINAPLLDQAP